MKKTLIILLFPMICSSQVMTDVQVFNNSNGDIFNVKNTQFKSYDGIDGLPYSDRRFSAVKIDGYNQTAPLVRYNIYEDEMEFKINNALNYIQKVGEMNITFVESNKRYVLKNYSLDGKNRNGYLVELLKENGTFSLYKKENIQIVEYNNNTTNSYLKQKNPYFERAKDTILIFDGETYTKFPKNAKEFNAWLASKPSSARYKDSETFIKKNKINFSKESDLIKLVTYINTL
ncbi:hypothetical protein FNJ88_08290 [Chryseobacterium sp. SNU WT5]|uniref:hypothetical protein n=1 Tax=Chryseobacterium sp. SNU WT5 TaxID=2594269 RepID=UPI00117E9307|nr:hypothetical protein [Chryseobacterium sp. SNU WT5]QDP85559.1 hypothetical protein FNJ88_08290 [Chryseobacterium sp. SNU WT5]